jgi:hypothetical protein
MSISPTGSPEPRPTPPSAGRKAVGILLSPVTGRSAALTIIGVPLVIFLIIGFKTASGDSSDVDNGSSSGQNSPYQSTYPAYPTTPAYSPSPTPTTQDSGSEFGIGPDISPSATTSLSASASGSSTSTASASPSSTATGPAAVVLAAYADVNQQNYQGAYDLGLDLNGESYQDFADGFSSTQSDSVAIDSVEGDVVTVSILAVSTDGDQNDYSGTYTVEGGLITAADLQQVN